VALLGPVSVPVVTASGATPACTVEYSVTSQWETGFQGAVTITNHTADVSSWSLTFDFAGGRKLSHDGALATGASVSAGFLGSWSGSNPSPTSFKLNGTTCNVDADPSPTPTPTPTPTGPPDTGDGTPPVLRASGNKLVDADGTTRRLLGVNRSGGEFMCVQGHGIRDGPVDDAAIRAIADRNANTVRIPLNEECRLGLSDIKPEYAGSHYIDAVKDLVAR
jgi:hypothetical protein